MNSRNPSSVLVKCRPAPLRAEPNADTTALEREIDERVYRLYGLTADEIKPVEEASQTKA